MGILVLAPIFASAATLEELSAQVQSLLSQLTALKSQAVQVIGVSTISGDRSQSNILGAGVCPNLYRDLSRGASGSDVLSLQSYLISLKLLTLGSDTGFYGALTEGSVQRWQAMRGGISSGSPASTGWGTVGSRTRASIAAQCSPAPVKPMSCPVAPPPISSCPTKWQANTDTSGCTTSYSCSVALPGLAPTSNAFSVFPMFGTSPLVVTFITKITNPTSYSGGSYQIEYADNSAEKIAGCSLNGVCSLDSGTHTHIYSAPGIYSARLIFVNRGACALGTAVCAERHELVASLTITVGATRDSMSIPVRN